MANTDKGNLSVTHIDIKLANNKVVYALNGHEFTLNDSALAETQNLKVESLKISQVFEHALPRRKKTFSEVKASLLRCWPSRVPVVSLFWQLMIHPIALIIKGIYPGKVYDTKSLSFKSDPDNRLALEDALQEVVDLSEKGDPTSESFRIGLASANEWRKKGASHQKIVASLSSRVMGLSGKSHVAIPGGYWKSKDQFQPILWAFQKKEDGSLLLSEMSYGVDTGSHAKTYQFAIPDQMQIEQLIYHLMKLSTEPEKRKPLQVGSLLGKMYVESVRAAVKKRSGYSKRCS